MKRKVFTREFWLGFILACLIFAVIIDYIDFDVPSEQPCIKTISV